MIEFLVRIVSLISRPRALRHEHGDCPHCGAVEAYYANRARLFFYFFA